MSAWCCRPLACEVRAARIPLYVPLVRVTLHTHTAVLYRNWESLFMFVCACVSEVGDCMWCLTYTRPACGPVERCAPNRMGNAHSHVFCIVPTNSCGWCCCKTAVLSQLCAAGHCVQHRMCVSMHPPETSGICLRSALITTIVTKQSRCTCRVRQVAHNS